MIKKKRRIDGCGLSELRQFLFEFAELGGVDDAAWCVVRLLVADRGDPRWVFACATREFRWIHGMPQLLSGESCRITRVPLYQSVPSLSSIRDLQNYITPPRKIVFSNMTFKLQLKHHALPHAKAIPISFKNYILAKHLLHFRTCANQPRTSQPMDEEGSAAQDQAPVADPGPANIPVMIASMSVEESTSKASSAPKATTSQHPPSSSTRTRRTLQCTHCDKVFTHRGDLNKHLRAHSGERPFACPHPGCTKRFAHSSNLRRHTVLHTGDKPFTCDKCGRSFNRKDKLLLHQQTKLCQKRSQKAGATSSAGTSRQ